MDRYDVVIVGSGPAGMGAAFTLRERRPDLKILILDREKVSTGGMRNDCKMNFTYPIGFPVEYWTEEAAEHYLKQVIDFLKPSFLEKQNIDIYQKRAERLGCSLLEIKQTHLGTDGGLKLIKELLARLEALGIDLSLGEAMETVDAEKQFIVTEKREIGYKRLLIAPGRKGFHFLQDLMRTLSVPYIDNIVDIGVRVETRIEHYPIVRDYYDPKFYFPEKVRTFCTNSGNAHVVRERYATNRGDQWYSVNGHAFAPDSKHDNGLVNFAILKTVRFTAPLASGQAFAENLGLQAALMGGGQPLMQRVGDFRLGSRSKEASFSGDLYDFEPTLKTCCPGDISLAIPAKILRAIWKAMKNLDTIVPGVLHPSTIMYYPEIKLYANKPAYLDERFRVKEDIWFAGDGAGTSRGITGAWASGIRSAEGILDTL
ncbi:MAG: FAD-dependent oxidoreductase [Sphaerochaeta sp.]|uniref:FAD-dependent oxidoreductase n=1 Tax=Sphaerochaeta sp. S2 TaxID=2798868 RepID=UPI0018E9126E|nr:FAD-dependent oxidoreductase [Sphaerochaeta sp. S2]MBJ2357354.1 FAD-dependent oxidoreductase [Sphaerochaeta sp. S2]MDD4302332.1 FAD-dependent oxidoreductase [Sphaerochaeta sp.]MDD4647367.1 FAD-dependent oxidoreductase [Sphaerochaeta sp.]MDY0244008.1 FAD-dependent oxidoreductase [Sphaerochaeta sp.]